jgi:hypothetical protein
MSNLQAIFVRVFRRSMVPVVSLMLGLTLMTDTANAGELDVLGGKLTWSDKMYRSDSCSRYDFTYSNQTGVELLQLGMELNDPFGRNLVSQSQIGIAANKSGTWNVQICKSSFTNGLGPYIVKLIVKDYYSTQRQSTKEIMFLEIPGSTPSGGSIASPVPTVTVTARPSPAPTVTVTATPAPAPTVTVTASSAPVIDPYFKNEATRLQGELTALRNEFDALKAKLTKICKVKPKPKFC